MDFTLRRDKGTPLTHDEVDDNFAFLKTAAENATDGNGYGFTFLADTGSTEAAPQSLAAGVRTLLTMTPVTVEGTDYLQPPFDEHVFVNNNKFQPRAVGDFYGFRLLLNGKSATTNNSLRIELDIGDTAPFVIYEHEADFRDNANEARLFTFEMSFYSAATFVANGAGIYVTADQAASVWGTSFLIQPRFKA